MRKVNSHARFKHLDHSKKWQLGTPFQLNKVESEVIKTPIFY